jgi:flagellar biosynthesis protein FlhG
MHDQADQLRKLARAAVAAHGDLAPGAPLVVISGGVTEAGVTTLACGLARELAGLGKRIALVDANFAAPALAERYAARPVGTIADVLAGSRRAVEVLVDAAEGVDLLPGEQQPTALNQEAFIRFGEELTALSRQVDLILLDAGHGMSPWVDRLWRIAQQILLVTTPATTAMLEAYAAVKLAQHEQLGAKLRLVVNRAGPDDASRVQAAFADTCQRFLACTPQTAAALPAMPSPDDDAWRRAVRTIAADLACDFRPVAARIPSHAARPVLHLNPSMRIAQLSPGG